MTDLFDLIADNPVAGFIVASEVGFWVLLLVGLCLRYPLRRPRAGLVTLALVPVVDVVLVVAVALDLHRGAVAGTVHGLAGAYLGFSIAFGPSLVRWADVRFAHHFAGGPAPVKPVGRRAKVAAMWREWLRVVVAASIASVVLLGLLLVADESRGEALRDWIPRLWFVTGVWFVAGPVAELFSRDDRGTRAPG